MFAMSHISQVIVKVSSLTQWVTHQHHFLVERSPKGLFQLYLYKIAKWFQWEVFCLKKTPFYTLKKVKISKINWTKIFRQKMSTTKISLTKKSTTQNINTKDIKNKNIRTTKKFWGAICLTKGRGEPSAFFCPGVHDQGLPQKIWQIW